MTQNTEQNVRTRDELLPCPFCGGEAERFDLHEGLNAGGSCIGCTRCFASGAVEFGFKENFISNWNKRSAVEARGAEEQRRKDGEIAGYLSPELASVLRQKFPGAAVTLSAHKTHTRYIPVYYSPANDAALEARIASLKEAEQLARADAEASKANAGWNFLTENVSSDPELPSCRLNRMFQEGDSSERIEETLAAFGIEACWDATEWDWQAPPEEMEELSADDLKKCDPRKDLTDAGWKLVDVWDTEDGEIVRMYARPISAALTREGGV